MEHICLRSADFASMVNMPYHRCGQQPKRFKHFQEQARQRLFEEGEARVLLGGIVESYVKAGWFLK